jgi:signal transduction histidine kinase
VSIGAPAAAFVQRHRPQLFSTTPMVFTAVEQRRVQYSSLTANDAVVAVRINYLAAVENIVQVLPYTKNVMVVVGTSPIERFWKEAIGKELEPLVGRINLSWTDELSFEELLKRAAASPPQSAIFWELMIVDAAGVVHEGDAALARLNAVTKAPIFSYDESFFGNGIVGGPLLLIADTSRETAAVAIRVLGGEKPSEIKTPTVQFANPIFDWRQLKRWRISEMSLPPGSEIRFREATIWDLYRTQILAAIATVLAQTVLILWLIYEHRRRHLAEVQSRNSMADLTRMDRVARAGLLSASMAHEVNQPLTGIAMNAGAAQRWLRAEPPNLEEVGMSLRQIADDSRRAADVITSIRGMFKKDGAVEKRPTDINKVIRKVLAIARIDLQRRGVTLQTQLDEQLSFIEGDEVQLQQLILNLVTNAVESMQSSQLRLLKVTSAQSKSETLCVFIEDTGTGIDPDKISQIFSPLFTTKPSGMGMGLSICHSVVENHGGRIWASRGANGGSIFQFELPTKSNKDRAGLAAE